MKKTQWQELINYIHAQPVLACIMRMHKNIFSKQKLVYVNFEIHIQFQCERVCVWVSLTSVDFAVIVVVVVLICVCMCLRISDNVYGQKEGFDWKIDENWWHPTVESNTYRSRIPSLNTKHIKTVNDNDRNRQSIFWAVMLLKFS